MRNFPTAALVALSVCTAAAGLLAGAALPADAAAKVLQSVPIANSASQSVVQSSALNPSADTAQVRQVRAPAATDIGFAQSMIAHHNQAILLALIVQNHPDETIRAMSQTIRTKQSHEVGLMLGWLSAWDAAPMTMDNMAWIQKTSLPLTAEDVLFISRCAANPDQMPGQASAAELEKLKNAKPQEQSRLFMQFMKRHHEAALDMAAFATRHATLPFVRSFALSVIKEQGREITWMTQQLAASQTY